MNYLSKLILILSVLTAVVGTYFVMSIGFTTWFMISSSIIVIGLVLSAIFFVLKQNNFFVFLLTAFFYITYARMLSTVSIPDTNLEMSVQTGSGVSPIFYVLSIVSVIVFIIYFIGYCIENVKNKQGSTNDMLILAIRIYVSLMLITHGSGHVLLGPVYFTKYSEYFASLHFPVPSAMLVLAGVIELGVALFLSLGLLSRYAALVGTIYMVSTIYFGGHFLNGYVWVIKGGGWQFGSLWSALLFVYVIAGGGRFSLDYHIMKKWGSLIKNPIALLFK